MHRVLIAECKQEISSFNPIASQYDDFIVTFGDAIVAQHHGVQSEVAGALGVLGAQGDIQVIPTYSAVQRTSGGRLAAADFARIAGEFCHGLRGAPEVDAAYFAL